MGYNLSEPIERCKVIQAVFCGFRVSGLKKFHYSTTPVLKAYYRAVTDPTLRKLRNRPSGNYGYNPQETTNPTLRKLRTRHSGYKGSDRQETTDPTLRKLRIRQLGN